MLIQFDSYSSSAGGGEQCACTACADDDRGASGHEIVLSLAFISIVIHLMKRVTGDFNVWTKIKSCLCLFAL